MKLGNITFSFNIWSAILGVVGLLFFISSPLYGTMLLVSAALVASDWKHRVNATIGVGVLWAVLEGLWLFALAGVITYVLIKLKVKNASVYGWFLFCIALLLMGHVLIAVFYGIIGAFLWKLNRR